MNVLIYGGNGVSVSFLNDTKTNLRSFLGDKYAITQVSADTLSKEPWEQSCSLLVIPGGRDLPYLEDLGRNGADERIARYVKTGGKYLGICAGAYYASESIQFERGTPMSVVGERPLKFYPGECCGAAFSGFVYDTEAGARSVGLSIERSAFRDHWELVPSYTRAYWNGGGYFKDAHKFKNTVQVLASYTHPTKDNIQDNSATAVAGVKCQVGAGTAVLWAIHPEHAVSPPFEYPANTDSDPNPQDLETHRQSLFRATLSHLGFTSLPTIPSPVPNPKPQYLVSNDSNKLDKLAALLYKEADPNNKILKDQNDTYKFLEQDQNLASILETLSIEAEPEPDNDNDNDNDNDDNDKNRDLRLVIFCRKHHPDPTETPFFNINTFYHELNRNRGAQSYNIQFGDLLLYSEVVTSTQTLLDKNPKYLSNIPPGLVSIGTHQVAGRGRGGNVWVSPAGCLQFSFVVKLPAALAKRIVLVQYLFALAVSQGCRSRPGYENVDICIKWPNDLYTHAEDGSLKKIGGILVNSSFEAGNFTVVVGTGINVSNSTPTSCVNDAIRQHNKTHGTNLEPLDPEQILADVLATFEKMWPLFIEQGFEPFLDLYYKRWLHSDQRVSIHETGKYYKIVGITPDGGLLRTVPIDDHTEPYVDLQPDGNTFDMFKNLIKVKK